MINFLKFWLVNLLFLFLSLLFIIILILIQSLILIFFSLFFIFFLLILWNIFHLDFRFRNTFLAQFFLNSTELLFFLFFFFDFLNNLFLLSKTESKMRKPLFNKWLLYSPERIIVNNMGALLNSSFKTLSFLYIIYVIHRLIFPSSTNTSIQSNLLTDLNP